MASNQWNGPNGMDLKWREWEKNGMEWEGINNEGYGMENEWNGME